MGSCYSIAIWHLTSSSSRLSTCRRLELSTPSELRLALRWIAILRDQVELSLAATGGVHSTQDVVKSIAAGANVVACASALLSRGPHAFRELKQGLQQWLTEHEYTSVKQLQGA
ncbi:MAG: hypothetical protein R3C56_16175 [Pirellulaceae bacterium]